MTLKQMSAPAQTEAPTPTAQQGHSTQPHSTIVTPDDARKHFEIFLRTLPAELQKKFRAQYVRNLTRYLEAEPELLDLLPKIPEISARALLNRIFPPAVWIIPDVLPAGLTILAGRPKVGKSWLALQLLLSTATGGKMLGRDIPQGRGLYLALEDSLRRLQDRMQRQSWPETDNARFIISEAFRSDIGYLNAGGTARLLKHIEREAYRVVIIDTLSRSIKGDQKDESDMTNALAPLQEYAVGNDIAVIVIDHHTKPKGMNPDPIDDILGSTAKAAVLDTAWGLYKEQGRMGAKLSIRGRDVMETTLQLVFDKDGHYWHCEGDADHLAMTEQREAVLSVLQMTGWATLKEIIAAMGQDWKTRGSVYHTIQGLLEAKLVVTKSENRKILYKLPENPEK